MATTYHYFTGKTKWAKVRKPDPKYDNFQVPLYLDDASKAEFAKTGLRLRFKSDEDGEFVTFRRPVSKMFKDGETVFGPPAVENPDGTEFEGLIGNGSTLTVKVSVYDSAMGKGHRLEAVRVDELVEYNPESNNTPVAPPAPTTPAAPKNTRKVPF